MPAAEALKKAMQASIHRLEDTRAKQMAGVFGKKIVDYAQQEATRNDIQHRLVAFLVTNFDVILFPHLDVAELVQRQQAVHGGTPGATRRRRIGKEPVRTMEAWHHAALWRRLHDKARQRGVVVIDADERYSTLMCTRCGTLRTVGGKETVRCERCRVEDQRDLYAARNIFLFNHAKVDEVRCVLRREVRVRRRSTADAMAACAAGPASRRWRSACSPRASRRALRRQSPLFPWMPVFPSDMTAWQAALPSREGCEPLTNNGWCGSASVSVPALGSFSDSVPAPAFSLLPSGARRVRRRPNSLCTRRLCRRCDGRRWAICNV